MHSHGMVCDRTAAKAILVAKRIQLLVVELVPLLSGGTEDAFLIHERVRFLFVYFYFTKVAINAYSTAKRKLIA